MMRPFTHRWRALALGTALVAGIGGAAASEAGSAAGGADTVALRYDPARDRLLKGEAHRLLASRDGGASWQAVPVPAAGGGRLAAVAASAGGALYVAGPGLGVQRSDDGGETWRDLGGGLPGGDVTALAVHSTRPETLYVVVPEAGTLRSEDAGETWREMDRGPSEGIRRLVHSDMPGSMQTGWLIAASGEAVRLSMDCFCGWRLGGAFGAGTVHDVAYDPAEPERILAVADGGVFRSGNGGRDWEPVHTGGPVKVALAFGPGGALYAATRDGALLRSDDHGRSWQAVDG